MGLGSIAIEGAALLAILAAVMGGARWIVCQIVRATRAIDGQLEAMRDNTEATQHLTAQTGTLANKVGSLVETVDRHGEQIERLDERLTTVERVRLTRV